MPDNRVRVLRRASSLPPVPPILQGWEEQALCHGFLGREGGSSRGPYTSLNLSYWVGDNSRAVDVNWQRARRVMPRGVRFAQLKQVHGKAIHTVGPRIDADPRPEGDGLVTALAGVVLCIFTADCVPVLLADTELGVIGALHAGWRGALAGIAGAGVRAMVRQGARASAIRAVLGPSIGPCCYEVDGDLARRFERRFERAHTHVHPSDRPGKAYLDLRGIVADQLVLAGLERDGIQQVGPCTKCESERYFSRRAAGGSVTGLQLSFIGRFGT
ncbi:MAG TPA: peptidoglycan editing factor PgeF [Candidatus Binataceae bacterium]|nr:peptidoglycan editing factor PgeF [Candidatus Binataceae bacterium]